MKVKCEIKPMQNLQGDGHIVVKKTVELSQYDYMILADCKNLINQLYHAVVKEGATIPPTETELWHFLNKIDVINEQHAILLGQAEN